MAKRGQPTKYKEIYIKQVDKYLKENQDSFPVYTSVKTVKGRKKNVRYQGDKIIVKLPTIGGFALFINVPERCVYDWREVHPNFSQSLEKIVKEQKKRLLNKGLSGDYNSTIAKLILSSNHGMVERKDITTGGEKVFSDEEREKGKNAVNDFLGK